MQQTFTRVGDRAFIRAKYCASDRRYVVKCPICSRETRIGFETDKAITNGSCRHVLEVERTRAAAWVMFGKKAA